MKKLVTLILVAVMAMSLLAGCGGSGSSANTGGQNSGNQGGETAAAQTDSATAATETAAAIDTGRKTVVENGERYDKLTFAINVDPEGFEPFNPNGAAKDYLYRMIYEPLFDCDARDYYPVIAKGYTEVDDLHWDVEIYDYVKDSKGNAITAEDVVNSYNLTVESGYANKFGAFESIEAKDDYTVEFTWTKPINGVLELEFILCHVLIFDKDEYEKGNFATAPVGTGPYTLETYTSGSKCIFQARDDYWQKEELTVQGHHAYIKTIEAQVISEPAQQVMALQNGEIDLSFAVPNENLPDFRDGGKFADKFVAFQTYEPSAQGFYMFPNMSGGSILSDDLNLRLAVFYALDADAITAASGGIVTPSHALCSTRWSEFAEPWSKLDNYMTKTDMDLSKEYLDKSNYNGETLKINIQNQEYYKNMGTVILTLLEAAGIKAELEVVDQKTQNSMLLDPEAFDLAVWERGSPNLVNSWNKQFNTSDYNGEYCAGMNPDPKVPELYKKCATVEGYTLENMTELMQYIVDNAYCYGFGSKMVTYVYSNKIAELGTNMCGKVRVNDSIFYAD